MPESVLEKTTLGKFREVMEASGGLKRMDEADRVYLLVKNHMRRLREQLAVPIATQREVERIVVAGADMLDESMQLYEMMVEIVSGTTMK